MANARERYDSPSGSGAAVQRKEGSAVGKHTLTQDLLAEPAVTGVGKRTLTEQVQRKIGTGAAADGAPATVSEAAAHGLSGASGALPHGDRIQQLFGRHDVSGIAAHTDSAAAAGARAMGAQAFATGDHVAFDGAPDLHTAAHEAAHVVQQRAGVSLKGGVGAAGDVYEQHADAVADQVVAGRSAETLLDRFAPVGGAAGGAAGVQRKIGAGQSGGVKVREVATGRTGVIQSRVWGKYTVRWDDGKQTPPIDPSDDDYELVAAARPTPPTHGPTTPAPTTPSPPASAHKDTTPPPTTPAHKDTTPAPISAAPTTASTSPLVLEDLSGVKVRQKSTGRTGAISGPKVWGKYPVRWDDGAPSSTINVSDGDHELSTADGTPVTAAPTAPKPPAVATAPDRPASTTTEPRPRLPAPTVVPGAATGGRQPDRDISHFDDTEFQTAWLAKQQEVHDAMQAFVPRFLALDPDAEVRVRGSIATGVKGNPEKVSSSGEQLLFNPTDFDIDAYVASDKLFQDAIRTPGGKAAARDGQVMGSKLKSVNNIIKDMRIALARIAGNRDAPKEKQFKFNVIIRTKTNDADTLDKGGVMTINPPESD